MRRMVRGEKWIHHYGAHEKESARGLIVAGMEKHPILHRGRRYRGSAIVAAGWR